MSLNKHVTLLCLTGVTVVAAFLVGIYWNDKVHQLNEARLQASKAEPAPVDNPLLPLTPQDYAQRLNTLMEEATLPYRLPSRTVVDPGDVHDSMTLQLDNHNTLIVLVDKAQQKVASVTLIINGDQSADSDASVLLTTAAVAAAALPQTALSTLTPVVAKLVNSYQNGAQNAQQVFGDIRIRYDRVPSQAGAWFWVEPQSL
ncbi:MAG: hypothetical protein QM617_04415 [Comamonas sp.]